MQQCRGDLGRLNTDVLAHIMTFLMDKELKSLARAAPQMLEYAPLRPFILGAIENGLLVDLQKAAVPQSVAHDRGPGSILTMTTVPKSLSQVREYLTKPESLALQRAVSGVNIDVHHSMCKKSRVLDDSSRDTPRLFEFKATREGLEMMIPQIFASLPNLRHVNLNSLAPRPYAYRSTDPFNHETRVIWSEFGPGEPEKVHETTNDCDEFSFGWEHESPGEHYGKDYAEVFEVCVKQMEKDCRIVSLSSSEATALWDHIDKQAYSPYRDNKALIRVLEAHPHALQYIESYTTDYTFWKKAGTMSETAFIDAMVARMPKLAALKVCLQHKRYNNHSDWMDILMTRGCELDDSDEGEMPRYELELPWVKMPSLDVLTIHDATGLSRLRREVLTRTIVGLPVGGKVLELEFANFSASAWITFLRRLEAAAAENKPRLVRLMVPRVGDDFLCFRKPNHGFRTVKEEWAFKDGGEGLDDQELRDLTAKAPQFTLPSAEGGCKELRGLYPFRAVQAEAATKAMMALRQGGGQPFKEFFTTDIICDGSPIVQPDPKEADPRKTRHVLSLAEAKQTMHVCNLDDFEAVFPHTMWAEWTHEDEFKGMSWICGCVRTVLT